MEVEREDLVQIRVFLAGVAQDVINAFLERRQGGDGTMSEVVGLGRDVDDSFLIGAFLQQGFLELLVI